MKVLFLVNARSGSNRRLDAAAVIGRSCDWAKFDVVSCGRKEDLDTIVDEAERDGCDAMFAVGGDGTVHELGKRLIGRNIALGIIPTGSGNGVARHLGIPMKLLLAIGAFRDADVVTIDTAEVNGIPFIGVAGMGFDAHIAAAFADHSARGMRTYLRCGFKALTSYAPEEVEIDADGEAIRQKAYLVTVANTSQYGNNARIAPHASVRDGVLDLVIVDETSPFHAPMLTARVFSGTVHRARQVHIRKVREITIRRKREGHVHLDGEPLTMADVLRVRVRPASLRVLVPKGSVI